MDAVKSGSLEVVDHLAAKMGRRDLDLTDKMDRNGLDVAGHCGLHQAVTHLVERHGFDVDRKSTESGMSALHWAALEGIYRLHSFVGFCL